MFLSLVLLDNKRFKVNFCKTTIVLVCSLILSLQGLAQVIPPGLGKTNAASWFAFGIQQDLDDINKWSSTTYVGIARVSDPDNYNLLQKHSIFILNQEFKNKFAKNWEYSLALSYRNQRNYADSAPYDLDDPSTKQEFRLYGRLSRIFKTSFLEITPTFRQEVQKYFTSDFGAYPENMRLRSRFRVKFKAPLTKDKKHSISLYSEQLFSTSLSSEGDKDWSRFEYKDSRFSLYYTLSPEHINWDFNVGYMNNLIGKSNASSTHYLGVDVIWKNPFNR